MLRYFPDVVQENKQIKEHCLLYCLEKGKENEKEIDAIWRLGRSEDLYWGVSASRDLGEELQQIRANVSAVATHYCEVFWKNWKNDIRGSGWAVETALFDTRFKPTVKECMDGNYLKENRKTGRRQYENGFVFIKLCLIHNTNPECIDYS